MRMSVRFDHLPSFQLLAYIYILLYKPSYKLTKATKKSLEQYVIILTIVKDTMKMTRKGLWAFVVFVAFTINMVSIRGDTNTLADQNNVTSNTSANKLPQGINVEEQDVKRMDKTYNDVVVNNKKRNYNGGGGGGGGGGSWGWGGSGGGGGGGGSAPGRGGGGGRGGGRGGGAMGGGGGWGWGGGGGGWWGWGCRRSPRQTKYNGQHAKNNRLHDQDQYYKIGEFAQCMMKGRCQGIRLDCPLHCGGPCFYDCKNMCKAHCRR